MGHGKDKRGTWKVFHMQASVTSISKASNFKFFELISGQCFISIPTKNVKVFP